jgi:hypothetical protein
MGVQEAKDVGGAGLLIEQHVGLSA